MNQHRDDLLERLLELIRRLYTETEGFLGDAEDQQRWYNRGYANGMLKALRELGYAERLAAELEADPDDVICAHEALPWGRAYRHGLEVGFRETHEVLG